MALKARLKEQKKLFGRNQMEFDRNAITGVITHKGKSLRIAALKTDDEQAGKISRMRGFGLFVQKNSGGHVQIFPAKKAGLDMRNVVRLLRLEELEIAGSKKDYPRKDLESENFSNCSLWYLHPVSGLVMNGSITHPEVPVTKISFERIQELILLALDDNAVRSKDQEESVA